MFLIQTDKPVLLRVKPTKGSVYGYEIRFKMNAAQGSMDAVIPATDSFVAMTGKNHLWSVAFTKPRIVGTGSFKAYADSTVKDFSDLTIVYERTPTYRPVAATVGKTRMPMSVEKDGTSDIIFPEGAVRVGSTWPGRIQAGNSMMDMTYKFLGASTHKKLKTWKIEGTPKGAGMKVIRPYIWHVDQRDGRTIFADGEVEITTGGVKANMTFAIVQVSRRGTWD